MTAREFEEELARAVQDLSIDAVKALPEPVKKPLRQAVGRVATNVIEPVGYSYVKTKQLPAGFTFEDVSKLDQTMGLFAPRNIVHTISSLVQDKPAYNDAVLPGLPPEMPPDPIYSSRRPLFREYFDLPTQDVTNAYVHSGKDYWINPNTSNKVAQETLTQFMGGGTPSGFVTMPGSDYNSISGSFMPGQPDPWNFDLHPEEIQRYYQGNRRTPLPSGIYGRQMLEALGNPAVLHTGGYMNIPPRENMIPSDIPVTQNYNPSFDTSLGPVDETLYRLWKQQYAPTDPGLDYDYRGAYQAGDLPQPLMGHWPDTFKKPNHPTFSDESQYADAYPEDAGTWFGDQFIPPFL